jgi:hypothetical protein
MTLTIMVMSGNITETESTTEPIIESGTHKYITQEIKMQTSYFIEIINSNTSIYFIIKLNVY